MAAIPLRDDVYYPESDDEPMGETGVHHREIVYLFEVLDHWYRDEPEVHVGGDQFHYYREGDPSAVYCPDVFVVKGVPKLPLRRTYKYWEEGRVPSLIIEVTSRSTWRVDFNKKKALYEKLGIEELIFYDPLDESREPPLQAFVLTDGRYRRVLPDPGGQLTSRTTGLKLRIQDGEIQAIDPATGEILPRYEESRRQAGQEKALRLQEEALRVEAEARAAAAEEELARLRRELARHQGEG